ncbi:hypothetical protein AAES_93681 [Amazona aestiva]|uniref:Uncharacterized protein n=1 Tax=Amazona aestiva TaxID=12930 RepID=A0A0Q3PHS3_AMAAE|nr:hypothetical protein AAES_93681 [Amazona aestiva]
MLQAEITDFLIFLEMLELSDFNDSLGLGIIDSISCKGINVDPIVLKFEYLLKGFAGQESMYPSAMSFINLLSSDDQQENYCE